jgi:hypothetical protein
VIRPSKDDNKGSSFLNNTSLQAQLDALNRGFFATSCCDVSQSWCNGECSVDSGFVCEIGILYEQGNIMSSSRQVSGDSVCVTRTVSDEWYTAFAFSSTENDMKRQLHVGNARTLNIYYSAVQSEDFERILGHATFPDEYVSAKSYDGVVLSDETILVDRNLNSTKV